MASLQFLTCVVSAVLILLVLSSIPAAALKTANYTFGFPFDQTYYGIFKINEPATISLNALQITPDSAQPSLVSLTNKSGRILFNKLFTLWEGSERDRNSSSIASPNVVASFNTTFLINIARVGNNATGEGMAFIIAPDLSTPLNSNGEYLGLTNSSTDGNSTNKLFAIELDTSKQDFDPDDNHIGVDINSIRSTKSESLSDSGITLVPNTTQFHKIWIQYDGRNKTLGVYMATLTDRYQTILMPVSPVLTMDSLDLSSIVNQESYFGFSASTGAETEQLNCVLSWNITVEIIREGGGGWWEAVAAVSTAVLFVVVLVVWWLCQRRRAKSADDENIHGALKSLPGMPREFEFGLLKKATGNFDDKNRLGEGGYGVVFKGVLPVVNGVEEVAVKKFTREDNIKSKEDFLSELTIINRLRHKHLVKLLGWCHKNKMLLLVYEYMPNQSLEKHIFCGEGQTPLSWNFRYKILKGVASALQYLHHEYDEKVIHRDIKANNIMLDANFNARLGDFGLARALDQEKTSYAEMGGIHGTMGYIAPECFHIGKATPESDVYAFGVVLLEVASGHRTWAKLDGFTCLGDWVWSLHRERRILDAMDPRIRDAYVVEEAERVLLLGLACLHPIAAERPNTKAIMQILCGSVAVPSVSPFKPAFVWPAMEPTEMHTSIDVNKTETQGTGSGSCTRESIHCFDDHSIV